ncbi:MAG: hypothetical protein QHJ81_11195 [Anaerolineae bacterium]|nr:hypothetical protein [Anaerolineae bacterium]
MPPRIEGCSCYSDAPVSRIVLDERGVVVGIVGLKQIFEQLYLMGCQAEEEGIYVPFAIHGGHPENYMSQTFKERNDAQS